MNHPDHTVTIRVTRSPKEVFERIKEVSKWWSKDYEGNSSALHDEFVICHPGRHYSKQRLVEVIPDQRMVWLVTESTLDWLNGDKQEWTNTRMVFDIRAEGDQTILRFTHEGLVPDKECYAMCKDGWNMVIGQRLFLYLTEGKTI